MSSDIKEVKVVPVAPNEAGWPSALPVVTFIIGTFSILTFFQLCGIGVGETAGLTMGIIQLVLGVGFFAMGLVQFSRGFPGASAQMIFAIVFGMFGGTNGVCGYFLGANGIMLDGFMVNMVWIIAGAFLVLIAWPIMFIPVEQQLITGLPGVGLILMGLTGIFGWPMLCYYISGVMFLITGLAALYICCQDMNHTFGAEWPSGPALMRRREVAQPISGAKAVGSAAENRMAA